MEEEWKGIFMEEEGNLRVSQVGTRLENGGNTVCLLDNNPTSAIFNSLCVEDEGTCHTELDGLRPTMGGLNDNFVSTEPFSQLPHL